MSHLDEGTLHALLDGELELAEVKEIQTHLGACAACGSRLQDVKEFLAEADRLVGTMDTPAEAPTARQEPAPPPPVTSSRPVREPVWDSAPELFLPESTEDAGRRRRWTRILRWAALIVVIVGAGRVLRSAFAPGRPELQLSERDMTSTTPATPPAVVSPEETGRPETSPAKAAPPPVTRTRRAAPAVEPDASANQPVAGLARNRVDTVVEAEEDTAALNAQSLAGAD
ncbi:MAG: zf-HC2 domain-containing protein, partial [Gemmatimonadota bacterium]|nr:zf-HC2 domain-containing protein [Gemmatimonadota bacterium]